MGFRHISRLWALGPLIVGIVGQMMQVSPQDAASNVSKWITSAGYQPPDWLLPRSVDTTVHYISLGLIAVGLIWLFLPLILDRISKKTLRQKTAGEVLYPLHFVRTSWWGRITHSREVKKNQAQIQNNPTTPDEKNLLRGYNHATAHRVSTKSAALNHLTKLRTEGVEIRNDAARLFSITEVDHWMRGAIEWMNDVLQTLKPVSNADSEWFSTLDAVPPARIPIAPQLQDGVDRAALLATYAQHDLRLVRLDDLLKKHGVGA